MILPQQPTDQVSNNSCGGLSCYNNSYKAGARARLHRGMQMAGWSPKVLTFKALKSLVNPTVRGAAAAVEPSTGYIFGFVGEQKEELVGDRRRRRRRQLLLLQSGSPLLELLWPI